MGLNRDLFVKVDASKAGYGLLVKERASEGNTHGLCVKADASERGKYGPFFKKRASDGGTYGLVKVDASEGGKYGLSSRGAPPRLQLRPLRQGRRLRGRQLRPPRQGISEAASGAYGHGNATPPARPSPRRTALAVAGRRPPLRRSRARPRTASTPPAMRPEGGTAIAAPSCSTSSSCARHCTPCALAVSVTPTSRSPTAPGQPHLVPPAPAKCPSTQGRRPSARHSSLQRRWRRPPTSGLGIRRRHGRPSARGTARHPTPTSAARP